ncbi:chalcone isomerase family protein [uncultured Psychrosphaera sp.]|uniref:chalcone isomerase family protein n=1 Tax=uncultured Psychrosphaera sp. TaxID=1403522 RepID=UPI00260DBEF4|nr:chalcone isomerase family protein [uncultured Psychrosphaera sp.]
MLTRRFIFICFIAATLSPFGINAAEEKPLANKDIETQKQLARLLQDQLPEELETLAFNKVGSAQFSVLFWDIYNSHLFTKSGRYEENSDQDVIFKIEYLKDISADELIKRTVEQWQHLKYKKSDYEAFIPRLKSLWPNISAGDSLTLYRNNQSTEFYFNNMNIGVIDNEEFYKLFLAIWLSPDTSEPELRQSLIGVVSK